jgi:hypothetical protein
MARSAAVAVENNFIKGLITEATGLNFPENACTDTDNCIFERIGNVTRRFGIDLEPGFTTAVETLSGSAITEFLWKAAALNGEIVFLVVQVGINLIFYRLDNTSTLSTNLQSFSYDLTTHRIAGSPDVGSIPCSMAAGNGVLFVTHSYCDPVYISYDPTSNNITTHVINIKIRDMRGLDQSATVLHYNDRVPPGSITDTIKYNLINQGWGEKIKWGYGTITRVLNGAQAIADRGGFIYPEAFPTNGAAPVPAIDAWFALGNAASTSSGTATYVQQINFPSEAEVWWLYKGVGFSNVDLFDITTIDSVPLPNAPAAKGRLIFNAFFIDRANEAMADYGTPTTTSGTSPSISSLSLPVESSGFYRPSQVVFFSGRAFYAGVAAQNFSTKIYFTRVVEQPVDYGRCYQLLDPTTESGGDLLASDGGVLVIPDVAQVIKLFTTGANLFVFATNGIWRISGGLGNTGFAADAYTISRISTINAQSALNFVDVDGVPIWWNNDGIWTLKSDQLGTSIQVSSISLTTISTFVENNISATNKRFVKGAFNPFNRIVQWIYRSTDPTTIEEQYQYDRILNHDLLTGSFYPWSLPASSPSRISGIFVPQGTVVTNTLEVVVTSTGATVQTSGSVDITVSRPEEAALASIFKYLVLTPL